MLRSISRGGSSRLRIGVYRLLSVNDRMSSSFPVTLQDLYKMPSQEQLTPCIGTIKGSIPNWLNGNLYRNGPAKFEVGDTKYNHLFDGLAMIHHFQIKNGVVTYRNRFVQSDTYKKNMAANRIVVSEFGTLAFPDPCKNIFQRFFSKFTKAETTDNTSVNIYPISDELYAATETKFLRQIDPETLDSPAKVNLSDIAVLHTATAHPHIESDGTVHNIGISQEGRQVYYALFKIPPSEKVNNGESPAPLSKASVTARIPIAKNTYPKYMHSFGMSENYYLVTEQPLTINILKIATQKFFNWDFSSFLNWNKEDYTRFRVIDRKTGAEIDTVRYVTDKLFTFHHTNVYEEDDHLIIDLSGYDNSDIMFDVGLNKKGRDDTKMSQARRYVLPLKVDNTVDNGKNLVSLRTSKATAVKKGSDIFCTHELLTDENTSFELPTINYNSCLGTKYRYFYGISFANNNLMANKIIKVDSETREVKSWYEEKEAPSEVVFVPRPGATDEDDGVLLSSVLDWSNLENTKGYLLVLDAKTLEELGRACFDFHLGRDFHGMFKQN
ncbi:beta,beta-carotene 15,15'-dioxygenase-like [Tubulanus polymorphus]|uniref:beta,beta-carotene 15,15'-dioxygenase-like n=1 Tax=Tubulanus polymorphus TaxID=672921 RepID=UPI003DA3E4CC